MKTRDGLPAIALAVALVTALVTAAWAESAGTAGATFLKLEPGARATAMGGAFTAMATDVNALHYNPGGLALAPQAEFTFMHNEYLEDVNHEYLGFVYPRFYDGTLGFDLSYVDLGSFQRYTIGAGNAPVAGGSFDASDLALKVAYGRQYNDEVAWGLGLKYIRENLDNVRASGWAVDAGVMYTPAGYDQVTFGMAVTNLGPKLHYQNRRERLPLTWRGGAAYRVDNFPVIMSAELQKSIDDGWGGAFGAEYAVTEAFALRLGYNSLFDAGNGVTCGAGFKIDAFAVDYAYQPVDDMGDVHRLSLNIGLGQLQPTPANSRQPAAVAAPPSRSRPVAPPPAAEAPGASRGGYYEYAGAPAPMYTPPPPIQTVY